jgi:hypothetical protein
LAAKYEFLVTAMLTNLSVTVTRNTESIRLADTRGVNARNIYKNMKLGFHIFAAIAVVSIRDENSSQ